MGNYNSHYENYYSMLSERKNINKNAGYYNNTKSKEKPKSSFIVRRVIQELTGCLCLFVVLTSCKYINTPKTQQFYRYSKELVNKNYDFKNIYNSVTSKSIETWRNDAENYIDKVKSKLTGTQGIKEKTMGNFANPVEGKIVKKYGESKEGIPHKIEKGIVMEVKVPSEVKSSFQGTVKSVGEDKEVGQYVLITHEDGLETKYSALEEIAVSENQKIDKGEVIGKITSDIQDSKGYVFFQLLYMGEEKNPEEYIQFQIE